MINVERKFNSVQKITIPYKGKIWIANCGIPNLLMVKKNEKLGFIDVNANIITPCKYNDLERFSENCATFSKGDGNYYYDSKKGAPGYYGTRGFINEKGEVLFAGKYTALGSMNEGFARFNRYNECGYIDSNWNETIVANYDDVDYYYGGRARVCKGELQGYIDKSGKEIAPCIYPSACRFHEGMAAVSRDDHSWGYINTDGEEVIKCQYDKVYDFKEDFAIVHKKIYGYQRYILIDKQGNEYFDWFVEQVGYGLNDGFSNGLIKVWRFSKNGTEHGFIDTNLNCVLEIPPYPYTFNAFSSEMSAFHKDGTNKYGFMNKQGEVIFSPQFTGIPSRFKNGFASVIRDNDKLIIDKSGEEVYKFKTMKGLIYGDNIDTDGTAIINEGGKNYVLKLKN